MVKKRKTILGVLLLITVFICGMLCGYILAGSGKSKTSQSLPEQNPETTSSSASASATLSSSSETTPVPESETGNNDDVFNYLAIGNSITRHDIASYWWNEVGMAASDEEHDYYHIVLNHLEDGYGNVSGVAYNFAVWEIQNHDRDETLSCLDPYLSPDLDLVTVQLGENVNDLTTFQEDFVSLLKYVQAKAPNARILVVGDFWIKADRDTIKESACKQAGVVFVSLEGIAGNDAYYCGTGTTVYDKDGNEHIVEHDGVARHPGDAGMKAIADRIIDTLQ